ncbi:immunoglobulin alpha Fc receptor isoform X1 [Homo sapiens]|nr:immunoglobulin alpha Fc receptor isoform X1 [Homo sapiens]XP_054186127.1 immunoglobulin alpha Fc receptor isoform X1 [Homo sapiens]XP_054186128.1 immunoglobulin alpha Fc receptor isoform X1 [Homo sapiens]
MPFISAKSSPVIPLDGSVKIQCQAIREAYLTQLMIIKNSTYREIGRRLKFWNETDPEFVIDHMDANKAGRYQCQYRIGHYRFRYSNTLELVVTGLYGKPFLSADRGLVLMPGENISLTCSSAHIPFDRFSLAKEGELSLPQHQSGEHPANFSLGPVDLNVSGIYRCYGWYNRSPYLWSFPSNALELVVTDSIHQDYTTQNLIRMAVAGLVLVALLAILVENWHSHTALNKEASADVAEPSWSQQMCQPGLTFARTPSVCK